MSEQQTQAGHSPEPWKIIQTNDHWKIVDADEESICGSMSLRLSDVRHIVQSVNFRAGYSDEELAGQESLKVVQRAVEIESELKEKAETELSTLRVALERVKVELDSYTLYGKWDTAVTGVLKLFGFRRNHEKGGEISPAWWTPDGDFVLIEDLPKAVEKHLLSTPPTEQSSK